MLSNRYNYTKKTHEKNVGCTQSSSPTTRMIISPAPFRTLFPLDLLDFLPSGPRNSRNDPRTSSAPASWTTFARTCLHSRAFPIDFTIAVTSNVTTIAQITPITLVIIARIKLLVLVPSSGSLAKSIIAATKKQHRYCQYIYIYMYPF